MRTRSSVSSVKSGRLSSRVPLLAGISMIALVAASAVAEAGITKPSMKFGVVTCFKSGPV